MQTQQKYFTSKESHLSLIQLLSLLRQNSYTWFPYYLVFPLPHTCHPHNYMMHLGSSSPLEAARQQEMGLNILQHNAQCTHSTWDTVGSQQIYF